MNMEVILKTLVTYFSQSGNTEKVAQGIFEGLVTKDKVIAEIEDTSDLEDYDVIFCGFPVIEHSVPAKMHAFLKSIPAESNIAFFATHGVHTASDKATTAFEAASTLVKGSKVLGTFSARGKVSDEVLKSLEKSMEHKSWVEEAVSAKNHPNEDDLLHAVTFANSILDKVKLNK